MHRGWVREIVARQAVVREELEDKWAERNKYENVRKKTQLDDNGKIDELRSEALNWCNGDQAKASELLHRATGEFPGDALPFNELNFWTRFGGKVQSCNARGCHCDFDDLMLTMAELRKVWDRGDEQPLFKHGHCPYVLEPNDLETIAYYRSFGPRERDLFMGTAPCREGELDYFVHTASTYRKICAHVIALMGCQSLDVAELSVIRQTHYSGCLAAHYKQAPVKHCFVLILGIYDRMKRVWHDRESVEVRTGIRVYNNLRGDSDDNALQYPVELILCDVGDALIIRGNDFKTETIAPPEGFDVYKLCLFFDPKDLSYGSSAGKRARN
jgi:hypothetical protein